MHNISNRTISRAQRQSQLPLLEQHMLWSQVLGVDRAWLIAHDTDILSKSAWEQYKALEKQRLQGVPMAYIIGWREFMGRRFQVNPDVLIPRPETEILVEYVLEAVLPRYKKPRVLDLGTGSGAIALSLALNSPQSEVIATDICTQALAVAQKNAACLGVEKVHFLHSCWYDDLVTCGVFDVIVSNPPYIAADDAHLRQPELRAEPTKALTDGDNGLQDLTKIILQAPRFLKQGGSLWLEHGWNQAHHVRELLLNTGFSEVRSIQDLSGIDRISGGTIIF